MRTGPEIRTLESADLPPLRAFLLQHAASSLPLLASLPDEPGQPFAGHLLGTFVRGRLAGVLLLGNNDLVQIQCPEPQLLDRLMEGWREWFDGGCIGLSGPRDQVEEVAARLGGEALPFRLNNTEQILLANAARTRTAVPPGLAVRLPHPTELELLYGWRTAFLHESVALPLTPELVGRSRQELDRQYASSRLAVLTHEEVIVAMGQILTEISDVAQIGGVYVPPHWRQRGYATLLLRGMIQLAGSQGCPRVLLLTTHRNAGINLAARAAGFAPDGDYGIILFSEPVTPPANHAV